MQRKLNKVKMLDELLPNSEVFQLITWVSLKIYSEKKK